MFQVLMSIYRDYPLFLGAIGIGVMVIGGVFTFVRADNVPTEQRGAYTLMSIYALAAAAGGYYLLTHYLIPLQ